MGGKKSKNGIDVWFSKFGPYCRSLQKRKLRK
jgi:hypothetical protein